MNLEQKRELLLKWKESGLSLPKWWKENRDALDLPHLSTLYAWVKELGFSTKPDAEVTGEEHGEVHDEKGDLDDSQEEDDEGEQDDSQDSAKAEKDDATEIDEEPEEDVIAKDRIEQLAPSTAPEPAQSEKDRGADEPKTGIKTQTWVIIGGTVVLGIGAYLAYRLVKRIKRAEPKKQNNSTPGGNPFAGYITVDYF